MKEPGEASMALVTLDLVTQDDARPAFPAVHLGGHAVLSCGELAGMAGESERVLRHDGKAGIWPARCASCLAGPR